MKFSRPEHQLNHKVSPTVLKWVPYPFSRGSSQPRNQTRVSCIAGRWILYQLSYQLKPRAQSKPIELDGDCISWASPEKQIQQDKYISMDISYRNCLTQLWRQGRFMTCHLHTGEPGELVYNPVLVQRSENLGPLDKSQSKSKRPRTSSPDVQEQETIISHLKQTREQMHHRSACLFYPGPHRTGWCLPHWEGPSALSLHWFKWSSHPETPDRHTVIMFHQRYGQPLAQCHWDINQPLQGLPEKTTIECRKDKFPWLETLVNLWPCYARLTLHPNYIWIHLFPTLN